MQIQLTGKRALVTGGNSGLGQAMALALADAGAEVAINYVVHPEAAQGLADRIKSLGRQAVALEADVADPQAVARMFQQMDEVFGGIDILMNNAGIDGHKMLAWEADVA